MIVALFAAAMIPAGVAGGTRPAVRPGADGLGTKQSAQTTPRPRILWVNWDGTPLDSLRQLLAEEKLPNLAAMLRVGSMATYAESVRPSLTGPAFAALWTGAPPAVSGITGNLIPPPGAPITAGVSGRSGELLAAEPIWTAVARQGKVAVAMDAPQSHPTELYAEDGRFGGPFSERQRLVNGYATRPIATGFLPRDGVRLWRRGAPGLREKDAEVYEGPEPASIAGSRTRPMLWRWPLILTDDSLAGMPRHLLVWSHNDPEIPGTGRNAVTAMLPNGSESITIPVVTAAPEAIDPLSSPLPRGFGSLPLPSSEGPIHVYLRCWPTDGGSPPACLLIGTGLNTTRHSELERQLLRVAPGVVGNGGHLAYRSGLLGPPIWEGGDGTAEHRYLETVGLSLANFTTRHRLVAAAHDHDLLITYVPYPDEILHQWWGWLSPSRTSHADPTITDVLDPAMRRVYGWLDAYLGELRQAAGPGVTTILASDHGLGIGHRAFRPNVVLAATGLLALDDSDSPRLDLASTRIAYYRGNTRALLINGSEREGGTVDPGDRDAVLRAAATALLTVRDPLTGRAPVVRVLRADEEPQFSRPTAGDLFLDLAPGYAITPELRGAAVGPTRPTGIHGCDPRRPDLRTIFIAAGPAIRTGVPLGAVRNVDIAPTVAAILGLTAPRQAVGKPIIALLRDPG